MAARDFVGYGASIPSVEWPNGANIAVQFVMNYEEGAESCILNGDGQSENLLCDVMGTQPLKDARGLNIESMYEYGSRAGFWRLHKLFTSRQLPITVYACGKALQFNPEAGKAMISAGWEVATHGYRWLDYQNVDEKTEREHIRLSVSSNLEVCGVRPIGLYQGKPSINTRRLVNEEGGFVYDSDSYADDLPYWVPSTVDGLPHLIIPYSLDTNDMKFVAPAGFNTADHFYQYLKDAFDALYDEGAAGSPKMMSIGMHLRVVGRPARVGGLIKFLDYIATKPKVWVCRRSDIAQHWYSHHYPSFGNPAHRAKQLAAIQNVNTHAKL